MSSVGQALGGAVGGAIGFFVGGPTGALYGAKIGIMGGGLIDPPKGPTTNGPRLSDLSVQTSTYGAPLPRIYGTVATFGNIFWLEGDKIRETSKKNKSGGKGGGGGATTKTFSYSATFAVGLCEGPIAGIRRLWVGAKLIYDAGSDDLETIIASNEAAKGFKLYLGTEGQMPDPRMQADKGVNNTPAYRGRAYIVMYDYPLADHGNSLVAAQVKAEVVSSGEHSATTDSVRAIVETDSPRFGAEFDGARIRVLRMGLYDGDYSWASGYFEDEYNIEGRLLSTIHKSFPSNLLTYIQRYTVTNRINEYVAYGYSARLDENKMMLIKNGVEAADFDGSGSVEYNSNIVSSGANYYAVQFISSSRFMHLRHYAHSGLKVTTIASISSFASQRDNQTYSLSISEDGSRLCISSPQNITRADVGTVRCLVLNLDDYSVHASSASAVSAIGYVSQGILARGNNSIYVMDGDTLLPIKTYAGHIPEFSANSASIAISDNFFVFRGTLGVIKQSFSQDAEQLSQIVRAEVLQSVIIEESDVETYELTDIVRGYRVAQPGAIRGAIDPLQAAWPFDIVQSGYQIKFLRRGKASVAEIPATKLDARPFGDAPTQELMTLREMDIQLPREVSLKYMDVSREYDQGEQRAARMNTDAVNRRDIDLAIAMNANEAKQTAEALLYLWWLERYDASFVLPPEYIALEPADVITVTGKWGEYELRLTSVTYLPDGRLECQAKYNSATIYESTATGEEGSAGVATIGLAGPSAYRLLDIPLLTDSLNEPGFPVAMSGYTTGWPGGVLYRSGDGGQTFDDIQGFTAPVSMAFARGTIGAGPTNVVDAASVLTVDVLSGELDSVTELQMLNGANHFAYGADGRWEIIAAQNAVEQADGSYVLTNFLRGRFGTEWAMTTHVAGDALVLVSDIDIAWIAMSSGLIGQSRLYRGITTGKAIDSDSDREFIYHGVNLKPLSPVYLNGSRHPSTNDWTLTWIRRGRVSPEWRDLVNVPVGEETEAYEIDVFSDGTYTLVLRTIEVTAATVVYTSAQQVTDFGSNQSSLYIGIHSMSATVGRGFALQASITR